MLPLLQCFRKLSSYLPCWLCIRSKCDLYQVRLLGPNCSSADRRFRLVPVNGDDDDVTKFTVTSSGRICVSAPLDFESTAQYHFYVVVDNRISTAGKYHLHSLICSK